MTSQTRHAPSKLDLTPHPRATRPIPTGLFSIKRLQYLCRNGLRREFLDILDKWLPAFGALSDSPDIYRPAQCEAARAGHLSILEDLIAHGCPLFDGDSGETVPEAATKGAVMRGDTSVLDFLLRRGWDVGGPSSVMMDGLQSEIVVKWFLAQGCDPIAPTREILGLTVTTSAMSMAPLSAIKLLLAAGGIVRGTDAVAQAVKAHVSNVLERLEVVEYLLDNGASVDGYAYQNAPNPSMVAIYGRETGLIVAARENKIDMVELLLRRGADRSIGVGSSRVSKDQTALEIAEEMEHEEIAGLLRSEELK